MLATFDCPHAHWSYGANSADGECLASWANISRIAFLYNPKDSASFYSGYHNSGTNADLAFASVDSDSLLTDRHVLENFSRSQHRPSLITPLRYAMPVPSMPVKRWIFRKAKWSHCITLTNKFTNTLLPPDYPDTDQAYQDFFDVIG